MPRIRILSAKPEESATREYSFTVVFDPVAADLAGARKAKDKRGPRVRNPLAEAGYQVTVPLLPGLITYGRTLDEARQMARDAIRCHLEGLLKAGEPIPDERKARKEKLRIALSA